MNLSNRSRELSRPHFLNLSFNNANALIVLSLSLIFSSALQLTFTIGGFYLFELLFLPFVFAKSPSVFGQFKNHIFNTKYLQRVILSLLFITVLSIFAYPEKVRIILSESRCILAFAIFLSLTLFARKAQLEDELCNFYYFSVLLYPLLFLFYLMPSIQSSVSTLSEFKIYPNLYAFILGVCICLRNQEFSKSTLLFIAWTPVMFLSLFRTSIFIFVFALFLTIIFFLWKRFKLATIFISPILAGILFFYSSASYNYLFSFSINTLDHIYTDSSRAQTQILYKLLNMGEIESDLVRQQNLSLALLPQNILPSLLGFGSSYDIYSEPNNNFDSGFLYLSRRLGGTLFYILSIIAVFRFLNMTQFYTFSALILSLIVLYSSGSIANIAAVASSFGALLGLLIKPRLL